MAVNETWLRPGEDRRAPTVPGYRLRHTPRPQTVHGGRGGGVGFYIKRGLTARTYPTPRDPKHEFIEQMWIIININGKRIAIGTAYRPPRSDVDAFLDAITDTISSLANCDHCVLVGDFNINILNSHDLNTRKLNEFFDSLGLKQLVSSPTHFTEHSETLIDLVCTDLSSRSVSVKSFGSINGHSLIISEFDITRNKYKPRLVTYRPLKNIDKDILERDLSCIAWEHISILPNVNDMVDEFANIILMLFNAHAPLKKSMVKEQSYPWITDTIKHMMQLRDNALTEFRKTGLDSKKELFKQLKSLVRRSLFNEKVAYFKYYINNKTKDPKALWKNIKSTVLPNQQNDELPAHCHEPGKINMHFLEVPGNPACSISLLTYFEYHRFNNSTFKLHEVSPEHIGRLICQLKSNAEGSDGISLNMLTLTLPHTLKVITDIVNRSINSATFPDAWKTATIIPIPKKSNPTELKDLRPISILPCLSKIAEKVVCHQITKYLEDNKILPELQSGFRKHRGTSTALLDVTDNILAAQDKGLCTILVLLDFSRAFDCINIDLLMSKLSYYGFTHNSLLWLQSYLSNRRQFVRVRLNDGSSLDSSLTAVCRGVPQGSILGPILFILYCADMTNCLQTCKYHIYADDVQVYISFRACEYENMLKDLGRDLSSIACWAENNGLVLNPSKTKYMIFGTKAQINVLPSALNVTLMGEPICRVTEARNLGVNMDTGLRYEGHVAESVQNCFYKLKILYKIRPYLSEALRIQLVESLVLSRLNYADTVCGPRLLAKTVRLIQRVQNACARFCFAVPRGSHVTPYLNKNSVLKMKSRRKLHLACLLFGVIKHQQPGYLYNKLSWVASRRECASRQCSRQLSIESHRTTAFRGSFRYAASKCWNNIPPPIRNLSTINTFKNHLKQYLIMEQKKQGLIITNISII